MIRRAELQGAIQHIGNAIMTFAEELSSNRADEGADVDRIEETRKVLINRIAILRKIRQELEDLE